ncbi:MAG: nitrile hydratase subunit beta [Pseudomonadota bacterium]
MNGPHDMGGQQNFGPVDPTDKPAFPEPWQRTAFALTLAMGAARQWNLDMSRFARESLPPADYLGSSYYEIWYAGLVKLLLEKGLVTESEVASGALEVPAKDVPGPLRAEDVAAVLARGGPVDRPATIDAVFALGDRVRAKVQHPHTHTRLPGYVRGHVGVVERVHGCHVFPDSNAVGAGEQPTWLYNVRFDGSDLWGADGSARCVNVDCWEPYLERA